jgi:hypothetical protein
MHESVPSGRDIGSKMATLHDRADYAIAIEAENTTARKSESPLYSFFTNNEKYIKTRLCSL